VETWQVIIELGSQSRAEVLHQLNHLSLPANEISVELREPPLTFRGADPAIIVATIGAVSANLTALITGLLQLRANRKGQRISIELASGDKIDVPADIPSAELDSLIKSLGKEPRRLILP
jgi:DNA-binding transcriptional ArsR family regulator